MFEDRCLPSFTPLSAMALSNVIQTVPDTPLPPSRGDLRGVIQV